MSNQWMKFYPGDYTRDTMHLTTVEHGAYLLLIMHYWTTGGLPDDDESLAAVSRMPLRDWKKIRAKIARFFVDGWKHKRIERELAASRAKSKKASESAAERWRCDRENDANEHANASAELSANADTNDKPPQCDRIAGAYASQKPDTREPDKLAAQQPEPVVSTQPTTSPPDPPNRLDDLEAKLRKAAGLENDPSPGLFDLSSILGRIEGGMSLENIILPAIRNVAKSGRKGRSWVYYTPAIDEAHQRQSDGKSAVSTLRPDPPGVRRIDLGGGFSLALDADAKRVVSLWMASGWRAPSPPPGKPGCLIPDEFLPDEYRREVAA